MQVLQGMTAAKLRRLLTTSMGFTTVTCDAKHSKAELINMVIGKVTEQPVGGQHTADLHMQHPAEPLNNAEEAIVDAIMQQKSSTAIVYVYGGELGNNCFIHELTRQDVRCLLKEPQLPARLGELNDQVCVQ